MTESGDHVVDTHELIWHVTVAPELSVTARTIMRDADSGNRAIYVPSIVVVEATYLVEKGRLAASTLEQIIAFMSDPASPYIETALDLTIARAVQRVSRTAVPDMPDRIIAATALSLGLPLITRDRRIHDAGSVPVVW